MHDDTKRQEFITLRAQDWTYESIEKEISVSRRLLMTWGRAHQYEIQNLRALRLEEFRKKHLISEEKRLEILGNQIRDMEEEMASRKLSEISTPQLFNMLTKLRKEVGKEMVATTLATPTHEIPDEERVYAVEEWKG